MISLTKNVSGKTHSKEQLNHYANQNNSNNQANKSNTDNRANQLNPNHQEYKKNK